MKARTHTMSEEVKRIPEKETEEEKARKQREAMEKAAEVLSKGRLQLSTPVFANGREYTELAYNFRKLTGMEYLDAMDSGAGARQSAFNITSHQAMRLFLIAATKETEGINGSDLPDIETNISLEDSMKAVQIAVSFFNASSRAGSYRISNL